MLKQSIFKTALLLGIALSSFGLEAREATLLDFTTAPPPKAAAQSADSAILDEFKAAALEIESSGRSQQARPQAILDLMAAELAGSPLPIGNAGDPDPIVQLPTARIHIPAWMQPTRPFMSHQIQSTALFSSNLSGGSYDRCDGRRYSPAWWLDPKVEARRAYHFDMVAAVACEYGVPTSLLDAVIAQESGYKYWAISHKGAMGLMQIMPGTASQLGLADPFNSLANMRAGARYLREHLDRFGRVDLALAAYNAGPHRRSLREGRLPMIVETLNYVRTIMTNWTRLSPRNVEIANVDRGVIAAAAVASSGFRSVNLVRYDGLSQAQPF
ncbi:lytic transglycosylase domain-containing protein [Sphingorhabdus sp.]|uniref:lytic transglycosylase domain-containing protein n=1 Tax=Sphingorhabdus sp. TaxID=1902408 RepID=UPI0032B70C02